MEKFGRETEQKMLGKPILTERERENRSVDLSEMIDLVNSTEPSLDSDRWQISKPQVDWLAE